MTFQKKLLMYDQLPLTMDPDIELLVQKDSAGYLTEGSVETLRKKQAQLRRIVFKWSREEKFHIYPLKEEFEKVRRQMMGIDFLLVDTDQTKETGECKKWDNKLESIYSGICRWQLQNEKRQLNPSVNHSFLSMQPAAGPSMQPFTFEPLPFSPSSPSLERLLENLETFEPEKKQSQVESYCDSNGNLPQNPSTKINAYVPSDEDDVTPCMNMPSFLQFDGLSGKYVFHIGQFDFEKPIAKKKLQDENVVKEFTWAKFNKTTSDIIAEFYKILAIYYKHGLSPKFRRHFCAAIALKLPLMEKKYIEIRELSSLGRLNPDLSDTVKTISSYSDLLFSRLEKHSRYQLKKLAKKEGFEIKVKKRNGNSVAENNRKRKRKKKVKD